jgi:ABC-type Mn2+/Zn2+ transport system permease subunit
MCVALTLSTLLGYLAHPIRRKAIYLGAALGALFLAKVYFFPAIVFIALLLLAKYYLKRSHWKNHLIAIVITALIFALPMLFVTYIHYGEISGFAGQAAFVQLHKTNPAAGYGTCFFACPDHLINPDTLIPWASLTLKSYFSVTGWMNVALPNGYYKIACLLFIGLIIFSLYQAIANRKLVEKNQFSIDYVIPLVLILGMFPSIFILSLLASQKSLPQPQGRYLFVTIPFLCILLSTATQQMLLRCENRQNNLGLKKYNLLFLIVAAWMTWTNLFAWKENISAAVAQKTPIALILNQLTNNGLGDHPPIAPIKKDLLISRLAIYESEANLSVPFIDEMAIGSIDELNRTRGGFSVRGWSYPTKNQGRGQYVIALDGTNIKAITELSLDRPDVAKALDAPDASRSGFLINVPFAFDQKSCNFKLYTLTDDFKLYSMPDVCEKISNL